MKNISRLIIILMLTTTGTAISIGASPTSLVFDNMIRGGYSEAIVVVSTGGNEDLDVHVEVSGQIKDWITIEPGLDFALKSKSRINIKIIIRPPADMGTGVFEGRINVRADPTEEVTGGTGMAFGAGITVKTVVNITGVESSTHKIIKADVTDTEIGQPIDFELVVFNLGNVKNTPKIRIDIFDQTGKDLIKSAYHNTTEILPSKKETINVKALAADIGVGRYMASIGSYMFIRDDATNRVQEELVQQKVVYFEVFEQGTLSAGGEMMNLIVAPEAAQIGDTVKITALFKNTGKIPVTVSLDGEILSGVEFVDKFESKEDEIEAGKTGNLVAYYTPNKNGAFTVKGAIRFGKKSTEPKTVSLKVGGAQDYMLYGAILVVLVVIVLAVVYLKGKKSN